MNECPTLPFLGEDFPKLEVKTTHGSMKLPKYYKGKWFVLFSHPADFTPVCTTEFVAFQKRIDQFRSLNCELIGMSIDQVFSHIKWVQWIEENLGVAIEYPIIADDMGHVAAKLGMIHSAKGSNTVRAVFMVDPEGKLRAMVYYPQEVGRNIDEIVRTVKALQTSDANKVAMPAGWPENELIGDEVIVPPATSHEEAKKRMSGKGCYDWWFCHKKLGG